MKHPDLDERKKLWCKLIGREDILTNDQSAINAFRKDMLQQMDYLYKNNELFLVNRWGEKVDFFNHKIKIYDNGSRIDNSFYSDDYLFPSEYNYNMALRNDNQGVLSPNEKFGISLFIFGIISLLFTAVIIGNINNLGIFIFILGATFLAFFIFVLPYFLSKEQSQGQSPIDKNNIKNEDNSFMPFIHVIKRELMTYRDKNQTVYNRQLISLFKLDLMNEEYSLCGGTGSLYKNEIHLLKRLQIILLKSNPLIPIVIKDNAFDNNNRKELCYLDTDVLNNRNYPLKVLYELPYIDKKLNNLFNGRNAKIKRSIRERWLSFVGIFIHIDNDVNQLNNFIDSFLTNNLSLTLSEMETLLKVYDRVIEWKNKGIPDNEIGKLLCDFNEFGFQDLLNSKDVSFNQFTIETTTLNILNKLMEFGLKNDIDYLKNKIEHFIEYKISIDEAHNDIIFTYKKGVLHSNWNTGNKICEKLQTMKDMASLNPNIDISCYFNGSCCNQLQEINNWNDLYHYLDKVIEHFSKQISNSNAN